MNELRLLNDFFDLDPMEGGFRNLMRPWRLEGERPPQIKIDLTEHEDSYAVKAEIPGVRKEDIDVRVDGKMLTISAEVKKAAAGEQIVVVDHNHPVALLAPLPAGIPFARRASSRYRFRDLPPLVKRDPLAALGEERADRW